MYFLNFETHGPRAVDGGHSDGIRSGVYHETQRLERLGVEVGQLVVNYAAANRHKKASSRSLGRGVQS